MGFQSLGTLVLFPVSRGHSNDGIITFITLLNYYWCSGQSQVVITSSHKSDESDAITCAPVRYSVIRYYSIIQVAGISKSPGYRPTDYPDIRIGHFSIMRKLSGSIIITH